MSKRTIDIICRCLLGIVAVLREEAGLPPYHDIVIEMHEKEYNKYKIGSTK